MNVHVGSEVDPLNLIPLDREAMPGGGRIYRATFFPAFGPWCTLTVRDFAEVGEVELSATLLTRLRLTFPEFSPPERCGEVQVVSGDELSGFRAEMAEARPEGLGDLRPDYSYRDGIGFYGEVRWDGVYHLFNVHDDRDLWRKNPSHGRFFLSLWRLARSILREEWSLRALDPRHFGDLLEREPGSSKPRTNRRRS